MHHQGLQKVYLVGGAVRDQLLGRASHDLDYVVVGSNAEEMRALGFMPVGADFPVFLHPKTKHEYALARTERKTSAGYTGFAVDASQSVTLEEDLARRDLTINAMAIDSKGLLIDPFNGQQDLSNKVLKHTTNAFVEDPVRVLRVARFLARYGNDWRIHPDTRALFKQMKEANELSALVPERVWKETEKALNEPYPKLYFEALDGLGIFPELECMHDVEQPPQHHPEGNVFIHTMLVLQRAADLNFDLATRFAALTHDFGKPICAQTRGNLHGHEHKGIAIIEAFCERLKIPNKLRDIATLTSEFHLHSHKLFELKASTLFKMIVTRFNAVKHPQPFLQFLDACQCDAQGRGETKAKQAYPQHAYGKYLLNGLLTLDTKAVVKEAQEQGKSGVYLGEAVKLAQLNCIKNLVANYPAEKYPAR